MKIKYIKLIFTVTILITLIGCSDDIDSSCSCSSTYTTYDDSKLILIVPNIFTPSSNGNGINDIFNPIAAGIDEIENYSMKIKDGSETVFESNSFFDGWDGNVNGQLISECKNFNYQIDITLLNGKMLFFEDRITLVSGESCPSNAGNCVFSDQLSNGSGVSQDWKATCN